MSTLDRMKRAAMNEARPGFDPYNSRDTFLVRTFALQRATLNVEFGKFIGTGKNLTFISSSRIFPLRFGNLTKETPRA